MIAAELLVFSIAGMLPRSGMRGLRARLMTLGCVLLAFEVATMSAAQVAMNAADDARARAAQAEIHSLQDSIAAQRAAARTLQENAARQSESKYSWVRTDGARSLNESLSAEAHVEAQARELARLEAVTVPTSSEVLGRNGMIAFSVARAFLLACIGAVMFGAAGALLRARRERQTASVAPRAGASPLPPLGSSGGRFAIAAASMVPALAIAAPVVTVQLPEAAVSSAAAQEASMQLRSAVPSRTDAPGVDARCGEARVTDEARYARVRDAVRTGNAKPSLRALYVHFGVSQEVARRYQSWLEKEGVIRRQGKGQGYALVQA